MFNCTPKEVRKSCEKGTGIFNLDFRVFISDFCLGDLSSQILEQKAQDNYYPECNATSI